MRGAPERLTRPGVVLCTETLVRASWCVRGRVPKDGEPVALTKPGDGVAYVCVGTKLTGDNWEAMCDRCGQAEAEAASIRVKANGPGEEPDVVVRATAVTIAEHLAVAGSFPTRGDNEALRINFEQALDNCVAGAVPNGMKPIVKAM